KGEAFAALCAMARLLESHSSSFHELADHVENGGGLSEDDKRKIRSEIENAHASATPREGKRRKRNSTAPARSGTPTKRSNGPRARSTASGRSIGSLKSITSSSTIWRRAPCTGASRLRSSISTCTACFSNSEVRSHEPAAASCPHCARCRA